MNNHDISRKNKWKLRYWLGFPIGATLMAGSFLIAYYVGSSFWGTMTGAWLGLIIIFLQALYTWSLVFNPMKGVDQPSHKQDKPRNED